MLFNEPPNGLVVWWFGGGYTWNEVGGTAVSPLWCAANGGGVVEVWSCGVCVRVYTKRGPHNHFFFFPFAARFPSPFLVSTFPRSP